MARFKKLKTTNKLKPVSKELKAVSRKRPHIIPGKFTPLESEHLLLSKAAYKSGQDLRIAQAMGYHRVPYLSTASMSTFKHKHHRNMVVAFRGSHMASDFTVQDRKIGMNQNLVSDKRILEAEKKMLLVTKATKRNSLSITGHSLGGAEAIYHGHAQGVRVTAFNPATALTKKSTLSTLVDSSVAVAADTHKRTKTQIINQAKIYRAENDLVSANAQNTYRRHKINTISKAKPAPTKSPVKIVQRAVSKATQPITAHGLHNFHDRLHPAYLPFTQIE